MSELTKQDLRKHFKNIRSQLSPAEKAYIDKKVFSFFIRNDRYRECFDLLVYVSGELEIGTLDIIKYALKDSEAGSKRVLCPRCEKGTNIMHFYRINSLDDLEKGSFGILEPKEGCERIDEFTDPVCIVPALSFDSKGYRLGFGKGFYDRFLADFKGITVGLCCESCMTKGELPRDEHDMNVNYVVTECGRIISC